MARAPKGPPPAAGPVLRNSIWQAGYERGVMDTLYALVKDPAAMLERAKQLTAPALTSIEALSDAIKRRSANATPAEKSARTRRLRRQLRDEAQAIEFAALIRAGDTSEQARAKMKDSTTGAPLGDVKAKRLRAIAVRLGLIRPRQMKPSV